MRKLLWSLLALVLVIAIGSAWLLSDANRFKPELAQLIRTNTGLQIAIAGNLAWRLWPPIQLVAEGVSADWTTTTAQPFLQARTLRLTADLWALIGKNPKLVIQGIAVDGLRARLQQTGDHANWMPPDQAGAVVPPIPFPPPAANPSSAPWEVDSLAISDAVIDYDVDGDATQIVIDALHTSDIAPGQEFPFHAKLTVVDDNIKIPVTIAAQVSVDAALTQWQFGTVAIDGIYGDPGIPFRATANAQLDSGAETFTSNDISVEFGKIAATLDVVASNLMTEPRYTGHVDVPQQRLDAIAGLLGAPIDEPVGLKAAFAATDERVDLTALELRYGNSVVTGTLGTTLGPHQQLEFDLKADDLTLDQPQTPVAVLGAGSFAALAFAAPAVTIDPSFEEPLLPLELIRTTDWNGSLAIAQLHYDGATFANTTIQSSNSGADIETAIELPDFFGGNATTSLKVDAKSDAPQWRVESKLANVDSTTFLAWQDKPYDWVAKFQADAELNMRGNTAHELTSSLSGRMNFDGGKGVLNIAEIKRQALSAATITGGAELINAWPERLNYQRLIGTWNPNGITQDFNLALDNLTLRANGRLDILADDMDMKLAVVVTDDPKYTSFKVKPLLSGLPLLARCRGALDAPICGTDEAATRKLLAEALSGKNPEMTAKLNQAIDEKVPEKYRDATRSLLDLLNKGAQQPKPSKSP